MMVLRSLTLVVVAFIEHVSRSSASLSMQFSPQKLVGGLTPNAIIRCEKMAYYNPYFTDPVLRISKKTPDSGWVGVAYHRSEGTFVNMTGPSATGYLNPADWSGFLEMRWDTVTDHMFGLFRCEFSVDSKSYTSVMEQSDELMIEETMNSDTLNDIWNEINTERVVLSSCLGYPGSDSYKFEDKIISLGRHLQHFIAASRDVLWKRGRFALPKTENGCPATFMDGSNSYLKFHEESTSPDSDYRADTKDLHLSKPVREVEGSSRFVNLRFCESPDELVEVPWPDGKYCINSLGSGYCPSGFTSGTITLDNEDCTNDTSIAKGAVASVVIHSSLKFCCTSLGPTYQSVVLPTDNDFYLYPYGPECQQVQGMDVTDEFVEIDTEDEDNDDVFTGTTPHVEFSAKSGKPIKIHLCYYSKKV